MNDWGWSDDAWITAYFENEVGPAEGLHPYIRIRKVVDGSAVSSGTMVELQDGWYKYKFEEYEITEDYYMLADSITLRSDYRYVEGATGEYGTVSNNIYIMNNHIDCRTILMRKLFTNRLELEDGDTDNWILYDDDSTTPLLTFNARDKAGYPVYLTPRMVAKHSKAR